MCVTRSPARRHRNTVLERDCDEVMCGGHYLRRLALLVLNSYIIMCTLGSTARSLLLLSSSTAFPFLLFLLYAVHARRPMILLHR